MTYGARVFNASGVTVLDIDDLTTRYLGTVVLSGPANQLSGSFAVSGITDDGTWVLLAPPSSGPNGLGIIKVTAGAGAINWVLHDYYSAFIPGVGFRNTAWSDTVTLIRI